MSRSRLVRALVLGTALTLAAQAAWAGPNRPGDASGSAWAFVKQLWGSFAATWSDVGSWLVPKGQVGCIIDPYGSDCSEPAPSPQADVGCILDPYGACRAGG